MINLESNTEAPKKLLPSYEVAFMDVLGAEQKSGVSGEEKRPYAFIRLSGRTNLNDDVSFNIDAPADILDDAEKVKAWFDENLAKIEADYFEKGLRRVQTPGFHWVHDKKDGVPVYQVKGKRAGEPCGSLRNLDRAKKVTFNMKAATRIESSVDVDF